MFGQYLSSTEGKLMSNVLSSESVKPVKLVRGVRVAFINSTLDIPYWSYGDLYRDGWIDSGCEVTQFKYEEIANIPSTYDLYYFHEIRYNPAEIPWHLNPRVLLSFDGHMLDTNTHKHYAQYFDRVYLNSKIDAEAVNIPYKVKWMPEGCNPRIHKDLGLERKYDVGFIGSPDSILSMRNGYSRLNFMDYLSTQDGFTYFNTLRVYGEDYNACLNQYRISLDRTIKANVGTRLWECLAAGTLPLWSRIKDHDNSGIDSLLIDGVHYMSYNDTLEDFKDKLRYLLDHPEVVKKIVSAGKKEVLSKHTYAHRCLSILDDCGIKYTTISS